MSYNICNRDFSNSYGFNLHLKSRIHKDTILQIEKNKLFLYRCDLCRYYTDRRTSWILHTKAKHHINGSGWKHLA